MMIPPKPPPSEIVAALLQAENILLAAHVFPDGDALGSQLGLGDILESLGKQVYYYGEEPVAPVYGFIPGVEKIRNEIPDSSAFDAAVAVDCGDRFRLGHAMENLLQIHPFIAIDHHAGHKDFGDMRWVEADRSSTAEMVFDLGVSLGVEISYPAAYCLYTAIVSDTGSFRYESTSAHTFQVAADLLRRGVMAADVAARLYDNYSESRLRLLAMVLESLELHAEGQIAVIAATDAMFAASGAEQEDTEDFINLPRAMGSVKVAAFLKETSGNGVKISLRAKGECDVSRVALKYGGGGHRNAAGCRVKGRSLAKLQEELVHELKARLQTVCPAEGALSRVR